MTIVKLKGGLGNQLFQYAFGRLLALHRSDTLQLDRDIMGAKNDTYRIYGLGNFKIKAEIADASLVQKIKYPYGIFSKAWRLIKAKVFRVYHVGYEANMLSSSASYLDGYFQSYKYLEPIRKELLEEVVLLEDVSVKYGALISEMSNVNSVAMHIRRGDYVSDAKTSSVHFICGLSYYEKAMALIKEKVAAPVFYIFSDDISWAKENLQGGENFVFVSRPEMKDYEELVLMSQCRHNIIANSSFSFWGAWLNPRADKIVVAPSKWNRENPKAYEDLLPPTWLKISVD